MSPRVATNTAFSKSTQTKDGKRQRYQDQRHHDSRRSRFAQAQRGPGEPVLFRIPAGKMNREPWDREPQAPCLKLYDLEFRLQ